MGLRLLFLALALAGAARAADPGLAPAKGRFLVAERGMRDPNFAETVVLLLDYEESGAMGLIVNWPTAAPMAELMPEIEGVDKRSDTVFVGGPVSRQLMLMLVRSSEELEGARRVFEDVHMSGDPKLLERVVGGRLEVDDFRLYSGYAGWSPGQLDRELDRGGWLVLPAEADLVFDAEPGQIWPELIQRGAVRWARHGLPGSGRRVGGYEPGSAGPSRSSQSR